MKKLILFFIICLLFCGCKNIENVEYQSTKLDEMLEVLSNNSVRFEEIYNRKYVAFLGEVYHISGSEIGISAVGKGTASCKIKKKSAKEKLSDLNVGDYIKVYGKVVDTRYEEIMIDLYDIEKPEPFKYGEIGFDATDEEVRRLEKNEFELDNGRMSIYKAYDGYTDEYGFTPNKICYLYYGEEVYQILLMFNSENNSTSLEKILSKLGTVYGECEVESDYDSEVTRWKYYNESVRINVSHDEGRKEYNIIFMDPGKCK